MKPFNSKEAVGLLLLALICLLAMTAAYCSHRGDFGDTSGAPLRESTVSAAESADTSEASGSSVASSDPASESDAKGSKRPADKEDKKGYKKRKKGAGRKSGKSKSSPAARRDPFADDVTRR